MRKEFLVIWSVIAAMVMINVNDAMAGALKEKRLVAGQNMHYIRLTPDALGELPEGITPYVGELPTIPKQLAVSAMFTDENIMNGVIVKNLAERWAYTVIRGISPGTVVSYSWRFSNGQSVPLPAFRTEYGGELWMDLWDGNVPWIFRLGGITNIELRLWSPNMEYFQISTELDFWRPAKTSGVGEANVEGSTMKIVGNFDHAVKVWIGEQQVQVVDQEWGKVRIDLNSIPSGHFLPGNNLVTVMDSSGRCDTLSYRYCPDCPDD